MGQQISDFSKDMPELGVRMQTWIQELQQWVSRRYHVSYSTQLSYLSRAGAGIVNYISVLAQSFLLALSGFLVWTVFVFIFTFFILTHGSLLRRFMIALFKDRHHTRVNEVMLQTKLLAKGYIAGLLIGDGTGRADQLYRTAHFRCKIRHPAGHTGCRAEYHSSHIGIYSAAALSAIITLSNSTPGHALQVILILLVIHFVDANILMPRIVGGRVKMNPLIHSSGCADRLDTLGHIGHLLFIPLAAILKIIFERVSELEPWAILMGTDEEKKPQKFKKKLPKLRKDEPGAS